MRMFRAFKFSFGVDILVFLVTFPNIGQTFIQFSGHTEEESLFIEVQQLLSLIRLSSIKVGRRVFMMKNELLQMGMK
jgi:hypothetical protein